MRNTSYRLRPRAPVGSSLLTVSPCPAPAPSPWAGTPPVSPSSRTIDECMSLFPEDPNWNLVQSKRIRLKGYSGGGGVLTGIVGSKKAPPRSDYRFWLTHLPTHFIHINKVFQDLYERGNTKEAFLKHVSTF